jgi:hypothetical protein
MMETFYSLILSPSLWGVSWALVFLLVVVMVVVLDQYPATSPRLRVVLV